MSESLPLFDAALANEAAERGIAQAAEHKRSLLKFARQVAIGLGKQKVFVTADDVQRELAEIHNISDRALGNAAGSLFRGGNWVWTGETAKSIRVHSHGRLLRVWKYIGN